MRAALALPRQLPVPSFSQCLNKFHPEIQSIPTHTHSSLSSFHRLHGAPSPIAIPFIRAYSNPYSHAGSNSDGSTCYTAKFTQSAGRHDGNVAILNRVLSSRFPMPPDRGEFRESSYRLC